MTPPRRRVTADARRYALLVFTEGAKTEVGYLKYWHSRNRFEVTVEVDPFHGTPLSLVRQALKVKKYNERKAKRRGSAHDEVWCVFDVDKHPQLDEAVSLAVDGGINLAKLDEYYEKAKERAVSLDKKHRGDETEFPANNPSSGVWRIVDSISR